MTRGAALCKERSPSSASQKQRVRFYTPPHVLRLSRTHLTSSSQSDSPFTADEEDADLEVHAQLTSSELSIVSLLDHVLSLPCEGKERRSLRPLPVAQLL